MSRTHSTDVLDLILDDIRKTDRPVVVFDLDSTLFSTAPRNLRILREFASEHETIEELRGIIETLDNHHMGWNVVDDLRGRGYTDDEVLARLKQYWFDRFFTNEYVLADIPLPGAVDYCHQCASAGAMVYYLTGRDEPGMGDGTRKSLRETGFPFDVPHAALRLKPHFEMADIDFKRDVIAELPAFGNVVACFENEPLNANLFSAAFPEAHMVFLDTVHSPNPPPLDPRILRRKDFQRLR